MNYWISHNVLTVGLSTVWSPFHQSWMLSFPCSLLFLSFAWQILRVCISFFCTWPELLKKEQTFPCSQQEKAWFPSETCLAYKRYCFLTADLAKYSLRTWKSAWGWFWWDWGVPFWWIICSNKDSAGQIIPSVTPMPPCYLQMTLSAYMSSSGLSNFWEPRGHMLCGQETRGVKVPVPSSELFPVLHSQSSSPPLFCHTYCLTTLLAGHTIVFIHLLCPHMHSLGSLASSLAM